MISMQRTLMDMITEDIPFWKNRYQKYLYVILTKICYFTKLLKCNKFSNGLQEVSPTKRPVWYVFSGMGSQWAGMLEGFMQLEPFAKSIYKAVAVLQAEGLDLLSILNSKDEKTFENVLYSAVSITSMQVIFWLLRALKLLGLSLSLFFSICLGSIGRFVEIDWN